MATNKSTRAMNEPTGRPVLVTTKHRGVFFGYLQGDPTPERLTLRQIRNVVYWCAEARGFLGLAASGPIDGCRIGPAAPEGTLFEITSVITCSEAAAQRFEDAPWSR